MSDNLEERVKALEDLMQSLARCFVAPPQPKQQTVLPDLSTAIPKHYIGALEPTTKLPEASKPKGVAHGAVAQFPEHVQKYLRSEGNKIYTTEYIHDRELWKQINTVAKDLGYEWVSAGKDSRWEMV